MSQPKIREAVILVGGRGERLGPLTAGVPKPLLPVAGTPVLERITRMLAGFGIEHIVLAASYHAEDFITRLRRADLPVWVECSVEAVPLGTGGGFRQAAQHLRGESVLLVNGDSLLECDLAESLRMHSRHWADVTIVVREVGDVRPYGLVTLDATGQVSELQEKPKQRSAGLVNAGCYVVRRSVAQRIPAGRPVSFERETLPQLLESGGSVLGYQCFGYWLDIGTPAAFVQASRDIVLGRWRTFTESEPAAGLLRLGVADIAADAWVGDGTTIHSHVTIGSHARVAGSVLMERVALGAETVVRGSALASGVVVHSGASVTGALVGSGAVIGAGASVGPGAMVWPHTVVPTGRVISPCAPSRSA